MLLGVSRPLVDLLLAILLAHLGQVARVEVGHAVPAREVLAVEDGGESLGRGRLIGPGRWHQRERKGEEWDKSRVHGVFSIRWESVELRGNLIVLASLRDARLCRIRRQPRARQSGNVDLECALETTPDRSTTETLNSSPANCSAKNWPIRSMVNGRVGRIVEDRGVPGPARDLAAHSARGRTPRTEIMFWTARTRLCVSDLWDLSLLQRRHPGRGHAFRRLDPGQLEPRLNISENTKAGLLAKPYQSTVAIREMT